MRSHHLFSDFDISIRYLYDRFLIKRTVTFRTSFAEARFSIRLLWLDAFFCDMRNMPIKTRSLGNTSQLHLTDII